MTQGKLLVSITMAFLAACSTPRPADRDADAVPDPASGQILADLAIGGVT